MIHASRTISLLFMNSGVQMRLQHVSCSTASGGCTHLAHVISKSITPCSSDTSPLGPRRLKQKENALPGAVSIHHGVRSCIMCVPAFTTCALSFRKRILQVMDRTGNRGKHELYRSVKNSVQIDISK
jgi:hypothetical protein